MKIRIRYELGLCLLILWLTTACGLPWAGVGPTPVPPHTSLPIYPNATQVSTRTLLYDDLKPDMGDPAERTSFVTNDTPEVVAAYYVQTLSALNWIPDTYDNAHSPENVEFGWHDGCPYGRWRVRLTTKKANNQQTSVALDIYHGYCY